jgi:hypothetical protein
MAQVSATTETTLPVAPTVALAALADYVDTRPAILTDRYSDYAVESGGVGTGTVATWRLHATKKRVRHVVADIVVDASSVIETDRGSSLVTTYAVLPDGASGTRVVVTTTWDGASGIGGFFERTFAPRGLVRVHDGVLANLRQRLAAGS